MWREFPPVSSEELAAALADHFDVSGKPGLSTVAASLDFVIIDGTSTERAGASDFIVRAPVAVLSANEHAFTGTTWYQKMLYVQDELKAALEALSPGADIAYFRMIPTQSANCLQVAGNQPAQQVTGDQPTGLNNCFFKTETTITHDELRFRSQAEIAIYRELRKRKLLIFPNAAAVLGGDRVEKREPDFLVCQDGKWGILEVMGDSFHTAQNAVKDHDRARLFKDFGILCIEFFDAHQCRANPADVVDRFLEILARHR
jgi:hypothetical protein